MRLSISLKLALLAALLVVLVAGATTFVLVFRFRAASERAMVARDRELARVLAGLRDSRGQPDFNTLTAFVASADKVDIGLVYAIHLDASGKMLQGALNPRRFRQLSPAFARALAKGQKQVLALLARNALDRRGAIKQYALPMASGTVRLGFDLPRIDARVSEQSRVGLLILAAGLVIGVLGALLLARRVAKPIRNLAGAMQAVAGGNLDQTVEVRSSDELASLASSFNQMMRALRDSRGQSAGLSPYVAAEVLERLRKETAPLEMVPEERPVTVLHARLALTAPGDKRESPRGRLSLVNDHLAPIIDAVDNQGGVIVAIDDEGVTAVWGAPFDATEPELSALRAGVSAIHGVDDEARRQSLAGAPTYAVAVGVATGRAACGNVGSLRRVTFGVVGEPRDVAVGGAAAADPGQLLISEVTRAKIGHAVDTRPGPPLFLEGVDEAIPLYWVTSTVA